MRDKKPYVISVLIVFILGFLSGCGANPAESIYHHLEKAVVMEEVFKGQQTPLLEAEKQEHEIYEQIISLGMGEYEEIVRLSDEAIVLVEKRSELMEKERASIEAGYDEFLKIENEINKLKNENAQSAANEMMAAMEGRFNSYQSLYSAYTQALELDQELYEMLKQEDLTIDELQAQIDKINDSYQNVMEHKDAFNESTQEYNDLKKVFYGKTDLKISYAN